MPSREKKVMRSIWGVAKNTITTAVRMKIAAVFLVILIATLPLMAIYMVGDGTTKGKLQSFVSYSLSMTSFLLSLLTIIISTYTLSSDIKYKRIFTVVTKPIQRWQLLCGKLLGVVILNAVLLTAFAAAILVLTFYIPKLDGIGGAELEKLNNEFFTARASIVPGFDTEQIKKQAWDKYIALKKSDQLPKRLTRKQVLSELESQKRLEKRAIAPARALTWEFHNLKAKGKSVFIRYKYNVAVNPPDLKIHGRWEIGDFRQLKYGTAKMKTPFYRVDRSDAIRTVQEVVLPADAIADDGYVAVRFVNLPANRTVVIFPLEDGLEVLYKTGSFKNNFFRAVLLIMARLIFLAALGISVSTWLSFSVAILFCMVVFFTGSINSFIIDSFGYVENEIIGFYTLLARPFMWALPRFDADYNPIKYVVLAKMLRPAMLLGASGMLLLKSLCLLLFGVFVFSRREIAQITV